ncbi:hypothetical protein I3843_06G009100 [Carya illinoinensis]|uniref:Ion transport domain-containing protein n=2 Tax=Carya illinoinensis TaxID=32201 RepID=A0A922ESR8_CARIL|nr:hypothetical protein I3842_06G008900 [Carya illinoinensis]KAG6706968.1 hypothetical protein I3842_06G008900 [Carya illinoinensis]KAG6706969.1 hypothetical protein I3842_06G008900 [Carya illinoinensis]KAG7973678.1 hypothetical protein I3843_06G009100 [Carya illinoinensis]KAG7973679.1 hypothetical protein I3843_06G009100 [Carya illinoinensis]
MRNEDVESQGSKNDSTGSGKKTTIEWCKQYFFHWDVAFLVVCIVAIAVEPIFFYLPVIKEATKCIAIDTTLKIIGICVRSFLDLIALGDLVARKTKKIKSHDMMSTSDYVINILSILPVPQVLVPIIFSDMRGYRSRYRRKFLNAVVLLQYGPRLLRIYRLWKIVNETIVKKNKIPTKVSSTNEVNAESNKLNKKGFIAMKAGLNLLLYLVASNVLGAFWYFVSIQRETTCWQLACKNDIECSKTSPSFNCADGFGNYTFLNDSCSVETPKTTLFDFGIFQEARQSGILASKDFFQKTMYCFWWGLRNLSSLGQNLETSSDYWENCFTVLISIFGLLLFLFFIGNLQVYMQWETSEEMKELSVHKTSKEGGEEISKQTSKERNEISKEHDEISKLLGVISKEHDEISKLLEVISKEHDEISKLLKIRPLPPVAPK